MEKPLRVLFLCTGNSARSQIGEALLRHLSRGRGEVFSAGSQPRAEIHPLARRAVKDLFGLDMAGQYPKALERFLGPAPGLPDLRLRPGGRVLPGLPRGRRADPLELRRSGGG